MLPPVCKISNYAVFLAIVLKMISQQSSSNTVASVVLSEYFRPYYSSVPRPQCFFSDHSKGNDIANPTLNFKTFFRCFSSFQKLYIHVTSYISLYFVCLLFVFSNIINENVRSRTLFSSLPYLQCLEPLNNNQLNKRMKLRLYKD